MTRSFRIHGFLAGLCLAAVGALALPLSAEEITVTVPPDSPPEAAPAKPATLPSFTGGKLSTTTAQSDTAPTTQQSTPATAAPVTVKHKAKDKKPATAKAPGTSDTTTGSTTPAATATGTAAAGDKAKTASKASPCKGIDETACSANKLCKWVDASTDAAGKASKARCRSLAMLKKEATKKTAKAGESDALPWASKSAAPATGADGAAAATTTETPAKPKKTKTASAKKVAKPTAPAAAPATDSADSAPPAPSNADPQ